MALRILQTETISHHVSVIQRLLSSERLLSSLPRPVEASEAKPSGPEISKILVPCRTSESNPVNHTSNHISRFYKLPEEVVGGLLKYGGVPKQHRDISYVFTETCLMVRKPFLEVKNYVESADFSKPALRIVLYGQTGCGKSSTLCHLIHYAFTSGFFIVHVPWVNLFIRNAKDASPSERKPGMMDVPLNAAAWLLHFRNQNQHLMNSLNLKSTKSYEYGPRDTFEVGTPLEKLLEFGIGRAKYACDVAEDVLKEVKQFSNSGLFKTMVLIDGYNGLFSPFMRLERGVEVIQKRCSFTLPFLDLTQFDWCNGISVLTVDELAHTDPWNSESHLPFYLLGREGWEHIDPFIPVEVKKFDSEEMSFFLDYLIDRKWIQHPAARNKEGREELMTICQGNPSDLLRRCKPL